MPEFSIGLLFPSLWEIYVIAAAAIFVVALLSFLERFNSSGKGDDRSQSGEEEAIAGESLSKDSGDKDKVDPRVLNKVGDGSEI